MSDYIQLYTTAPSRDEAERIARMLVERRLAACVQVLGPITSTYRWQGAIETSQEWLCLAKSRSGLFDAMEKAIRQIHPYQVPEILVVPILAGTADYLAWLGEQTEPPGPGNG